jgi:8-oxo-dGTP diphosphatase
LDLYRYKKSDFIPIATKKGFFFHSCDERLYFSCKKNKENAIIPTAANHTLGVGAVVINDKNEILSYKRKNFKPRI